MSENTSTVKLKETRSDHSSREMNVGNVKMVHPEKTKQTASGKKENASPHAENISEEETADLFGEEEEVHVGMYVNVYGPTDDRSTINSLSDIDYKAGRSLYNISSESSRVDSVIFRFGKSVKLTFVPQECIGERSHEVHTESGMASNDGHPQYLRSAKENIANGPTPDPEGEGGCQLSGIETIITISVLEELLAQLQILSYTTNNMPWKVPDMTYKTLKERFTDPHEKEFFDELNTEVSNDPDFTAMKLKKLQSDRSFIKEVFDRTLDDLKDFGMYSYLSTVVTQELMMLNDERQLKEEVKKHQKEISAIKKNMKALEDKLKTEVTMRDKQIVALKRKAEAAEFFVVAESRYLDRWEIARREQQIYKLRFTEKENQDHLLKIRIAIENETRAFYETQVYLTKENKELEDKIEDWEKKQKEDLEMMEREITELKTIKDAQKSKIIYLSRIFEKRENVIRDYLNEKNKQKLEEEHDQMINAMARRMQLWWRRILRRRAPSKKGNTKAKGKKEKKGKTGKTGKK